MSETAQETTAEMAMLVEHEHGMLATSVLPGEKGKYHSDYSVKTWFNALTVHVHINELSMLLS